MKQRLSLLALCMLFAATLFCCKRKTPVIVPQKRLVDMMAKNRTWHGFYSMDVFVDSVVHHDTSVIAPFTDSISVVDDSTIKFSGISHMFATQNLSYQYTDSVKGYAYYYVKNAYYSWLYYYYNKDSIHCVRVTSGTHNGWVHLFTP